ncbi:MAG: hypothetical protein GC182_19195 [Rhodopseudomonas sp.]|nr:hypothetical protein [Rhodopseudomonas sp.]
MADRPQRGARAIAIPAASLRAAGVTLDLNWGLAIAGMMLVMLAPALWNGFPLIFPDTGGYFSAPMQHEIANGRSALYGFFLVLGIPLGFWPCIIVQSAMMAWLFSLTLRINHLGGRPWLAFGVVALLTVVTSLPWFAGQLMPDILFPAAILALYGLTYADGQTTRTERFGMAAVIAFAIPSHMAAAGMAVGIILALLVLSFIRRLALPKPRLHFAAAAVAAGLMLCPVSNLALTGTFGFTPGGVTFLFGRLVEDGLVKRYLDDQCPDPSIKLCAYRTTMPDIADDWLWGDTPLYKLGGWRAYEPEERRIILATLERYPLAHLTTAVTATLSQFVSFATEVSVDDNDPTFWSFKELIPQWQPALMAARQQSEGFDVGPLNFIHIPAAGFAIAGLCLALLLRRRLGLSPETTALCLVIMLALLANATICGVFSHPVDRYQSRLALLAPFAIAILIAQRRLQPASG